MKIIQGIKNLFWSAYVKINYRNNLGIEVSYVEPDPSDLSSRLCHLYWEAEHLEFNREKLLEDMKFVDEIYKNIDVLLKDKSDDDKFEIALSLKDALSIIHNKLNIDVLKYTPAYLEQVFTEKGYYKALIDFSNTLKVPNK